MYFGRKERFPVRSFAMFAPSHPSRSFHQVHGKLLNDRFAFLIDQGMHFLKFLLAHVDWGYDDGDAVNPVSFFTASRKASGYPTSWRLFSYMSVSKNRGTPKWMVYNGKPYYNGWFGGTIILGNIHIFSTASCNHESIWFTTGSGLPLAFKASKWWTPKFLSISSSWGVFSTSICSQKLKKAKTKTCWEGVCWGTLRIPTKDWGRLGESPRWWHHNLGYLNIINTGSMEFPGSLNRW